MWKREYRVRAGKLMPRIILIYRDAAIGEVIEGLLGVIGVSEPAAEHENQVVYLSVIKYSAF